MQLRIYIFLLPLLLSTVYGCSEKTTTQPPITEVTVVTLDSQPVTIERHLTGRLNASVEAEVRPQATGIVSQRLFKEGGQVKSGEPLYQLDDATYRADVSSAQAKLARAQALLLKAQSNAQRAEELIKIKAISNQDYDNTMAALHESIADVKVAEAELEHAKVVLSYGTIRSPISGFIGKSSITKGALVTENQVEPLAKVQQLDPMFVDLNQTSAEFLQLRRQIANGELEGAGSLPVTLILEDGSIYSHPGKLAFSEISVDPTTGSYTLRIYVDNPQVLLLPGMYVRATLSIGVRPKAILAPQQAILRDHGGNTRAMVVNSEGMVEAREVQVSQAIGDKWLVDTGLSPGDRVIIEGLQKIKPGMPVQVIEASAEMAAAQPHDH